MSNLYPVAAGTTRLAADLRRWDDRLYAIVEQAGGVKDFAALLSYIVEVGEAPIEELHDLVTKLGPAAEEVFVTTAEMLRAEGQAKALVQLLTLKFGPVPPTASETVRGASTDQLETWTDRVLTADTLDEVLR